MAEKLDPHQVVTFAELPQAMMYNTEGVSRVLVRACIAVPDVPNGAQLCGEGDKQNE